LSSMYGMGGVCLMGETHGQIIDAKSAEALLKVLTKILDVTVDMTALESKAKETEEQINRMASMINAHKKAVEQQQDFVEEAPSYYIR
ncbi:MAG TPA: proteasome assembly chaperone family protein, partial [Candidatus Altiarchaeales archaeon]|nr:proteasome assembly chaperone family protein [Candidatus Altiarchaeales archaeon]